MLTRFFKPKWQHPNASVRRRALEALAADAEDILSEAARNDPDPELRCVALKRLKDVLLLEGMIEQDKNPRVKEAARQRLWGLIAGTEPGLSGDERSAVLRRLQDLQLMEHVARHGRDAELRCYAVAQVTRQPLLVELASDDAVMAVRLAALQRIEDTEQLEQICKAVRGRDKRIYRAAKERLDQQHREQQRPLEIQQRYSALCTRAEALLKCTSVDGLAAALAQVQKQWLALAKEDEPGAELIDRFATAVVAIGDMEQSLRERAELREHGPAKLCDQAEALAAQLDVDDLDEPALLALGKGLEDIERAWQPVRALADDEELARYRRAAARLREGLAAVHRHLDIRQRALAVVEQAERQVADDKPVTARQLATLHKRWPNAGAGEQGDLPLKRFQTAILALEARLDTQRQRGSDDIARAEALMAALEQALENGESRSANSLQQKLQAIEKDLDTLGLKLPVALGQRRQRLQGRLRELWDWQRFSNTAEREKLCDEVEALIDVDLPPQEIAQRIKAARSTWNGLGSTDREAIGPLRERFNKACDTAFKPCAVFYDEEARKRAANMAERSALCERLEQFIAEYDWDHIDIKELDRVLRQARDTWKSMGAVDRGAFKQVSGKFYAAADTIVGHLRKAREANLAIKEGLAKQAEALISDDIELGRAMDGIRDLQQHWKQVGPGPRREEQGVWKRFQQAGDAVFARRNAERDAVKKEQQGAIAARETLCERLEALLEQVNTDTGGDSEAPSDSELRHALNDIDQAWSEAQDLPGRARASLDQRYRKLVDAIGEVLRGREGARRAAVIKQVGEAALLVAEMEAAGDDEARAALQQRWQALTDAQHYPGKAYLKNKLLQARWQRAQAGSGGDAAQTTAAERLCLKMEVEAGVDSPPEAAQDRMALQVERLNQGLGAGDEGAAGLAQVEALEREWWGLGRLAGDTAMALTRRFIAARDAAYRNAGG